MAHKCNASPTKLETSRKVNRTSCHALKAEFPQTPLPLSKVFAAIARLTMIGMGLLLIASVAPMRGAQATARPQNAEVGGSDIVVEFTQPGVPTPTGAQNIRNAHVAKRDPNDPDHAHDPNTGDNFNWDPDKMAWINSATGNVVIFDGYLTLTPSTPTIGTTAAPSSTPQGATAPSTSAPPSAAPKENKTASTSGFTPTFQLRGFGGATFVNGNTSGTAGFDGAVLFPLGNRILVGPTAGFEWINSSIVHSVGTLTSGSTFIHESAGFKNGNFGGEIQILSAQPNFLFALDGGATVANSTITQQSGFCGLGNASSPAGCTVTSTSNTNATVTGPFIGGYISHSIFSHVGIFAGFDFHHLKDTTSIGTNPTGPPTTVFDLHYIDVIGGFTLTFGPHSGK